MIRIKRSRSFRILTFMLLFSAIYVIGNIYLLYAKQDNEDRKPENIEMILRELIDKPMGELTSGDFKNLTELDLSGREIESMEGVNLCTNLRKLDLSDNSIEDITAISALTELIELDLSRNFITNLEPLRNCRKLESLNLEENSVETIEALADLKNLVVLNVSGNLIYDFTVLKSLPNLKEIYLRENIIDDLKQIADLPNLLLIDLSDNYYIEIEPLVKYGNFNKDCVILLNGNFLSDEEQTVDLPNLRKKVKVQYEFTNETIENCCRLTLRALGSTELAYQDQNGQGNYGSWANLIDPELNYIQQGFTRSDIINFYSIAVFNVTLSVKGNDGKIQKPSTFQIVALPYSQRKGLRTFAIDDNQTPLMWIGPRFAWTLKGLNLKDPKFWMPLR